MDAKKTVEKSSASEVASAIVPRPFLSEVASAIVPRPFLSENPYRLLPRVEKARNVNEIVSALDSKADEEKKTSLTFKRELRAAAASPAEARAAASAVRPPSKPAEPKCPVCQEIGVLQIHSRASGERACCACINCIRNWSLSQLQETGVRRENAIRCICCHLSIDHAILRRALRNDPPNILARLEERIGGLRDLKNYHRCPRRACFGGGFVGPSSFFSSSQTDAKCPICEKCWTLAREPSSSVTEYANKIWTYRKCKHCPSCAVPVERNKGCPHMTCTHCKEEFCWQCGLIWTGASNHTRCSEIDASWQWLSRLNREGILVIGGSLLSFVGLVCLHKRSPVAAGMASATMIGGAALSLFFDNIWSLRNR